jgi:hypothetical protein
MWHSTKSFLSDERENPMPLRWDDGRENPVKPIHELLTQFSTSHRTFFYLVKHSTKINHWGIRGSQGQYRFLDRPGQNPGQQKRRQLYFPFLGLLRPGNNRQQ